MRDLVIFYEYNINLRKKLLSEYLFNFNENQYRNIELDYKLNEKKRLRIIKLILWCKFKGFENNISFFQKNCVSSKNNEIPFARMQFYGNTDAGHGAVINFGYEKFSFHVYLNRLFVNKYFSDKSKMYQANYISSFKKEN
jgi:hypothetical protein